MSINLQHILALETATPVCSVALSGSGGKIITRRAEGQGMHAEQLLPFIRDLLSEGGIEITNLDAVIVSSGPGSYTGLRVASSSVKGLLFGMKTPVISCNTLAGIAANTFRAHPESRRVHAVLDARRHHLYYQPFRMYNGLPQPEHEMQITELEKFPGLIAAGEALSGTGIERLADEVTSATSTYGHQIIDAEGLIHMVNQWSESGQPDSGIIARTVASEFYPQYYSSGPVMKI